MKSLRNSLTKPSPDHRLWALWVWNKKITEDEMIRQLKSFIDKGFGGVAIRPTRDISPAYLSEEFFYLFKQVLIIAKENSIGVRIADDFSIPWNDFFQSQAEQNSDYRAKQLVLQSSCIISSKESFEYHVPDKSKHVILAVKIVDGKINPKSVKNLLTGQKVPNITWKAPAGEWQVMVFKKTWYLGPRDYYAPNVFNPKVAHVYIQTVLEKLTTTFSKYIPSPFEGFICEMPTYLPSNNSIPWDDDLIIKYRSRYKKNLITILPSLFYNVDDNFAKNRSHVYNFMFQAMYDRFPAVLETWAKKHRISQWVLCPERNINWSDNTLKDVMAIPSANLSTVGIQNHDGTEKNYSLVRAMADMNSVEFRRETVGVIGRNTQGASATLQSLKTEIDYHAVLGTSKILLDGCFFNLDHRSYIKTPLNPAWYHPEWDEVRPLCEYANRLLSLSQDFTRSCAVAVVMPSLSVMADYLPSNDESFRKGLQVFRKVVDILRSRNIEFDVVSEQFLISCSIKVNGEFGTGARVRKGNYQAVIFPYSRLVNNSTFVFLEKLAIKKGTIIFLNEAPQGNFDEGQSASFTSRVARLTRPKNENVHITSLTDFSSKLSEYEQGFRVSTSGKPASDIHTIHGFGQNYNIYFIHNDSIKRDYFCTVELPEANHVYTIDCLKGEIHEILKVHKNEESNYVELNLAPKQTHILVTSSKKIVGTDLKKDKNHTINVYETTNRNYRVVLKDRWLFSPDTYNVLPLASWSTRVGLSRDSGGYSHYYEAYFETVEVPDICLLVFCGLSDIRKLIKNTVSDFEVSLNGIIISPYTLKPPGETDETDASIDGFCGSNTLKYDIREAVMKGINRVSIRTVGLINNPTTIIYPPVLAGHFSIKKSSRGWTIDTPKTDANFGSWTKHGFPYLSGKGVYEQVFEVPADYNLVILRFNQVSGGICTEINGIKLGVINWQPMAIDITDAIEPRRNVLRVTVVNTIDNLLRMNGRASGLIGEAFLDIY